MQALVQASARVDVPTVPMTLKYTIEHADDGSGMCKAYFASDDALHVIFFQIVGGYNMPGTVQVDVGRRRRLLSVRGLFGDLEIDPIFQGFCEHKSKIRALDTRESTQTTTGPVENSVFLWVCEENRHKS